MKRLRLALVSTGIRRDLLAPLQHFTKIEIVHLYRAAAYGDLTPADLNANLRRYRFPHELERLLFETRADVIQGVEPFSLAQQPYLWTCSRAARRLGARLIVVTLENRPLEIKFNRVLAYAMRRMLKPYFNRACLILPQNDGAARNIERCGIPAARLTRAMWGTWGVDLNEFSPAPSPSPASGGRWGRGMPPTILFAGRLHPEKGIFVLLDAFALVRAQLADAQLVIVGDGPARDAVNARAAQFPASAVEVRGVVKHRAMPEVFRAAAVVALPSLTTRQWAEQVGMTALQAMACGVPVVAARSGALPEYVPDGIGGILVNENDARALADALVVLLRAPERRAELGQRARDYACAHYDARQNVQYAQERVLQQCA